MVFAKTILEVVNQISTESLQGEFAWIVIKGFDHSKFDNDIIEKNLF